MEYENYSQTCFPKSILFMYIFKHLPRYPVSVFPVLIPETESARYKVPHWEFTRDSYTSYKHLQLPCVITSRLGKWDSQSRCGCTHLLFMWSFRISQKWVERWYYNYAIRSVHWSPAFAAPWQQYWASNVQWDHNLFFLSALNVNPLIPCSWEQCCPLATCWELVKKLDITGIQVSNSVGLFSSSQ